MLKHSFFSIAEIMRKSKNDAEMNGCAASMVISRELVVNWS